MNISGILNPLRKYDMSSRETTKTASDKSSFEEQITRQSAGGTASSTTSSIAAGPPDTSVAMSGEEYLKLQQEIAAANSPEAKSVVEHKALMEAANNAAIDGTPATEPQEILARLSDPAKATLDAMKAGKDVSKGQWTALCKEMKDMGAITEDEFNSVRTDIQIVPAGYELHPVMVRELQAMYARSQGIHVETEMWTGDPFEYLNSWTDLLDEWQEMLVTLRDETGARKYNDFSPIREQVSSCHKVSDLVQRLFAY